MIHPHSPVRPRRMRGPTTRTRTTAAAATLLAALALITAGCGATGENGSGDPEVAALPSTSAHPSKRPDADNAKGKPSELAYARCMRAHGVKDFPDPSGGGEISINATPGSDLSPDNPTYKAADGACKSLMPGPSQAQKDKIRTANIAYSRCMRSHGVKDFPDPGPDGGLQIQMKPGGDLDPQNPTYQAADKACQKYAPDGGKGKGSTHISNGDANDGAPGGGS